MKVLFAVSSENIVDSIIKEYQKEYKEIISSKNVYYFNAIVKELQRNQSYDRIVISEDLEPFTNNNYDAIDKFIFEKLDSISDEAINSDGRDIPIVLICSERREKGDDLLVKLFSIAIYDALIGQDRRIEEVCKLLNKPRTKKEAKTYYKIEQGEYEYENENNVSEIEIQNILTHYRKIAKNEDKYVESFESIAEQYNDEQLKIIIKFLPLEVKAVLEEKSPKYQAISTLSVSDQVKKKKEEKNTNIKVEELKTRNPNKINGPIIIPSAVKTTEVEKIEDDDQEENEQSVMPKVKEIEDTTNEEQTVKRRRGRPKKIVEQTEEKVEPVKKRGRGRPKKVVEVEEREDNELPGFEELDNEKEEKSEELPGFEDDEIEEKNDKLSELPGFEDDENTEVDEEDNDELPGFDDDEEEENDEESELPGFDDDDNDDNEDDDNDDNDDNDEEVEEDELPGFEQEDSDEKEYQEESKEQRLQVAEEDGVKVDVSYLLTQEKKLVAFLGTSKNGTSFLVNNIACILSEKGIKTAIVDLTRNKNSYYIYTKNKEDLRQIAYGSMEALKQGEAKGIEVNKNLTVYTSSPNIKNTNYSIEKMLTTLLKNYDLVLLDCDYTTNKEYFRAAQEVYLVQSMDVLTIQPLTEFLRRLKLKNVLDEQKLKAVINKVQKVKGLNDTMIIGGMSTYNDPEMSIQDRLFNMKTIDKTIIPFDADAYACYLSGIANCEINIRGYNKNFLSYLGSLADKVYPTIYGNNSKKTKNNKSYNNYKNYNTTTEDSTTKFSNNVNETLNQMKKQYK